MDLRQILLQKLLENSGVIQRTPKTPETHTGQWPTPLTCKLLNTMKYPGCSTTLSEAQWA